LIRQYNKEGKEQILYIRYSNQDMNATEYISSAPSEWQALLTTLHNVITKNDSSVSPVVKPMMAKEMILYEQFSYMKYGLASAKKYMSLHCLPMYMNPAIHEKYAKLLPAAKFQKGCINFTDASEMPIGIVTSLITDCSAINIAEVLENRKKKKK
jgi:hypothetical protein